MPSRGACTSPAIFFFDCFGLDSSTLFKKEPLLPFGIGVFYFEGVAISG